MPWSSKDCLSFFRNTGVRVYNHTMNSEYFRPSILLTTNKITVLNFHLVCCPVLDYLVERSVEGRNFLVRNPYSLFHLLYAEIFCSEAYRNFCKYTSYLIEIFCSQAYRSFCTFDYRIFLRKADETSSCQCHRRKLNHFGFTLFLPAVVTW